MFINFTVDEVNAYHATTDKWLMIDQKLDEYDDYKASRNQRDADIEEIEDWLDRATNCSIKVHLTQ